MLMSRIGKFYIELFKYCLPKKYSVFTIYFNRKHYFINTTQITILYKHLTITLLQDAYFNNIINVYNVI